MPKGIKILIAVCMVFHMLFIVGIINFLQIPEVIRCEILTAKYGHEFENPELLEDAPWTSEPISLKVIHYDDHMAKIYYICESWNPDNSIYVPEKVSSRVIYERQTDGKWVLKQDIATPQGRVVMPYWWHNVNGSSEYLWWRLTWLVPGLAKSTMG